MDKKMIAKRVQQLREQVPQQYGALDKKTFYEAVNVLMLENAGEAELQEARGILVQDIRLGTAYYNGLLIAYAEQHGLKNALADQRLVKQVQTVRRQFEALSDADLLETLNFYLDVLMDAVDA